MSYRVLWSPHAEDRLEQLLRGAHAADLAGVAQQIDRILIATPKAFGESRYDTVRVGFARPLGVLYEVMDDVRTVVVYDVWRIDRRA